ncbi:hypothetical protein BO70DRAFT_298199 [Aspergillus heteromorphus CBS 117.55]|uniref:Fungal N-terminal domain-containing protein n=1 Tax=Aspergillus heteromorphus CBS 117.55 TaxID=1448321 RepID=A0A317VIP4_9EURO|nr:uncharacterized protein BO70DRAFT_298199 [Aspergillus heteromorphus CBS 117.55]PWY71710.1 hypothetical protein BO70DRAFT_298199 [Aspergillus heteromorphus CBS 117.55]
MSPDIEVIDIPKVAQMTYDLCSVCTAMSLDAPDGFKQLVSKLESLNSVLQELRDGAVLTTVGQEKSGEERKITLQRGLNICYSNLKQLKELVDKYQDMGLGNGKLPWQLVNWATQEEGSTSTKPATVGTANGVTQDLYHLQLREQLLQQLRVEPRDRYHQPDADLFTRFNDSAHKKERSQDLTTKDWLRAAVWWLLKARTALANGERPSLVHRGGASPSTMSWSASHQAYVDLLKASYVLYDVVLKREKPQELLEDENRKLISDLSEGVKDGFSQFNQVDVPDYAAIRSHNLDIWEPLQPEEITRDDGQAFSLGNAQYTTVDPEDAGHDDEQILFRTFVNAGIGSKKLRMRTRGAPYMLLLSTKYGESEPKITICNQCGTFCLQRDLEPGDLAQLVQVSDVSLNGLPIAKSTEPVTLKFDSVNVSISFQYLSDMMQVINMPKAYFEAVQLREPLDAGEFSETVIFKSSAELLEQLRMPSMKPMNPPVVHRSCEVRILERTFKDAWRSIRRMVVSSSAAERDAHSMEIFMPMSHVQVSREKGSGYVMLKWSDTCQERSGKTDGNYHPLFSYVYDAGSPNIGIGIRFRSQEVTKDLERVILTMNAKPSFSWVQTDSSGHVYDVVDVAEEAKHYKAVLVCQSRLGWSQCSLHYLYRDTDYTCQHSCLRVRFPRLFHADYISSHVEQLYRADQRVYFSHCEKTTGNMVAQFNEEHVLRGFMSSLASSHKLMFSRRATSLSTKERQFFRHKRSTKGDSEVQIWRDGDKLRLAARWSDHIMDRWLTLAIPSLEPSRASNWVAFPPLAYSRGMVINMAQIAAGSPKNSNKERQSGPITITFPTTQGASWQFLSGRMVRD